MWIPRSSFTGNKPLECWEWQGFKSHLTGPTMEIKYPANFVSLTFTLIVQ